MRCVNVEPEETAKAQNVPFRMNGVCVVVAGRVRGGGVSRRLGGDAAE